MSSLQITMPDGTVREYDSGTTGFDVAKSIAPGLAKAAIAIKVDGVVKALSEVIDANAPIQILTFDSAEGREVFWHSSAHIMAQAVQELFPKAKLAIGPAIAEGWYYDFDVEKPFSPEDLERIEKRMAKIVSEGATFSCTTKTNAEAIEYYQAKGEIYKVELLEGFAADDSVDDEVTIFSHSTFEDLCRGPHIPSTRIVKAFKLIASSGAYWRGDEKRQMLQRIYGVSYPKKAMLEEYLHRIEEAKKRDHRLLGKQLELFAINDEVGAGLVLWLPRGSRIRNEIENFWRQEHIKSGYELVYSPHIARLDLWHKSGHTDFYSEDMYQPMVAGNQEFQLKPMNCPFHIMMFKNRLWSYRDMPQRWAELGTVYRNEAGGVLHGLMRVRGFTQDDAHHFVTPESMEDELVWLLDFCVHILSSFGFSDYAVKLSTRPEKAIGDIADWDKAENGLRSALEKAGLEYETDEGAGAFYGPKIDIDIKDSLGRAWQCSTIQFDFSLPERFNLEYTDSDGKKKRPYMIHRALFGSVERFFGVLVEHYAGNFPLWLAPVQVAVLPISDDQIEYGKTIMAKLKEAGLRVELDRRSDKIGGKIRAAEVMKTPLMLVVGAKEVENQTVSVRRHGVGDIGVKSIDEVLSMIAEEIANKGLAESQSDKENEVSRRSS